MTTIEPGQTFRSADPRDNIRIRIERYTHGHDHAWVVDAVTGKRARWIQASSLHVGPLTKSGQPRRTGYVLEAGQ